MMHRKTSLAAENSPHNTTLRASTRVLGVIGFGFMLALASCAKGCGSSETPTASNETAAPAVAASPVAAAPAAGASTAPSAANAAGGPETFAQYKDTKELKMIDQQVGTGAEATAGKQVLVHYTGWLTDGKKFDSSVDRGQKFPFQLGAGQVIRGWDQGVAGMKVGGKRRLVIPADMGYGPAGTPDGTIPPNSTLVFDVELFEVK